MKIIMCVIFVTSSLLLAINVFGLTQNLRPINIETEHLRFGERDVKLSQKEFEESIRRRSYESNKEYSLRLTKVIADGIAHIHWEKYEPSLFNQRVPFWENWILFSMSFLTNIKEYDKYHFADPYKSMERGIGVCGDTSMIMHQLLKNEGIESKIISFSEHVVISAELDGEFFVLDPDFGVVIPSEIRSLNKFPKALNNAYNKEGYSQSMDNFFEKLYAGDYQIWNGVNHFITKKYYFEKFSYVGIWLLPTLGIFISIWYLKKHREISQKA